MSSPTFQRASNDRQKGTDRGLKIGEPAKKVPGDERGPKRHLNEIDRESPDTLALS